VLVVSGRNDLLFGPPHVAQIAALLPNATYVELEDGAHFIPYQQPAEFDAAVRAFLGPAGVGRSPADADPR
jgi:3-oxoadipate enol-lactonase